MDGRIQRNLHTAEQGVSAKKAGRYVNDGGQWVSETELFDQNLEAIKEVICSVLPYSATELEKEGVEAFFRHLGKAKRILSEREAAAQEKQQ
jgi:hypothetical protein